MSLLATTLVLRTARVERPAVFLLKAWAAYVLTPPAILDTPGRAPRRPGPGSGLVFCLGLWFAGFFGGNLQLYNLTERGMSLRMLIDVAQSGGERGGG